VQYDTRCPLCRTPPPTSAAERLRRVQKHVDEGNAEAQFMLGDVYLRGGMGLTKSPKRAVQLYERAAAQGHAPAQIKLGCRYEFGEGVEINYETAALWYLRAAEQGHPAAQSNLGNMFADGQGVAQSHDDSVRWWRLAAAQGLKGALYNLGVCYANGIGVPQDDDEALRLFERAVAQGYSGKADEFFEVEARLA